ncbi:hypothetical protein EPUS_09440 [Endocarpon pusillum Z07020]|uniref:Enoyl reductase (ER) domain-containing protein n=1 Tax=Endocarpon pusillum (strain Z07020 / HMAS-L-300199) TaxID=1263415 RepID=U1GT23_ENDPU|nr:uncharacterized protein EPUS_09440 [Endocarpon pusillum Z07020]ERF75563.1 hypothetical protein EPUS_09440 [Endocarpon pusillum Z07020]
MSSLIPGEMLAAQVVKVTHPSPSCHIQPVTSYSQFNERYQIHKIPTPRSLGPNEILLKTAAASLCHTDLLVTAGKFPTKLPRTASHEGTGIVQAVGSAVKDFKIGDRVMAGLPKRPCGDCINCKGPENWHQYCQNIEGCIGFLVDGAFAEYLVADSAFSAKVPDDLSLVSAAPLACAGITIWGGIVRAAVPKNGWLAIVGSGGGLGHLGIQMARVKGINVIGIDAPDEGIALSKEAGCEHVFDARKGKEEVVREVQALTNGLGVEAAINVSYHEYHAA